MNRNSNNWWLLYMMNISLFNKFLNNWLSNDLISWNLNSFNSTVSFVLSRSNNIVQLYLFVSFSVELNINIFSLNNWLNISIIVNFFSRSSNSLGSGSFLENWLSVNWLFSFILWLRLLEFNGFFVVNNSLLIDWLSVNFFSRSLDNSVNYFFGILNWSSLYWHIVNLSFTSVNLKLDIFSQNCRLDVFFSNSGFTRYVNRNGFCGGFTINNRL